MTNLFVGFTSDQLHSMKKGAWFGYFTRADTAVMPALQALIQPCS